MLNKFMCTACWSSDLQPKKVVNDDPTSIDASQSPNKQPSPTNVVHSETEQLDSGEKKSKKNAAPAASNSIDSNDAAVEEEAHPKQINEQVKGNEGAQPQDPRYDVLLKQFEQCQKQQKQQQLQQQKLMEMLQQQQKQKDDRLERLIESISKNQQQQQHQQPPPYQQQRQQPQPNWHQPYGYEQDRRFHYEQSRLHGNPHYYHPQRNKRLTPDGGHSRHQPSKSQRLDANYQNSYGGRRGGRYGARLGRNELSRRDYGSDNGGNYGGDYVGDICGDFGGDNGGSPAADSGDETMDFSKHHRKSHIPKQKMSGEPFNPQQTVVKIVVIGEQKFKTKFFPTPQPAVRIVQQLNSKNALRCDRFELVGDKKWLSRAQAMVNDPDLILLAPIDESLDNFWNIAKSAVTSVCLEYSFKVFPLKKYVAECDEHQVILPINRKKCVLSNVALLSKMQEMFANAHHLKHLPIHTLPGNGYQMSAVQIVDLSSAEIEVRNVPTSEIDAELFKLFLVTSHKAKYFKALLNWDKKKKKTEEDDPTKENDEQKDEEEKTLRVRKRKRTKSDDAKIEPLTESRSHRNRSSKRKASRKRKESKKNAKKHGNESDNDESPKKKKKRKGSRTRGRKKKRSMEIEDFENFDDSELDQVIVMMNTCKKLDDMLAVLVPYKLTAVDLAEQCGIDCNAKCGRTGNVLRFSKVRAQIRTKENKVRKMVYESAGYPLDAGAVYSNQMHVVDDSSDNDRNERDEQRAKWLNHKYFTEIPLDFLEDNCENKTFINDLAKYSILSLNELDYDHDKNLLHDRSVLQRGPKDRDWQYAPTKKQYAYLRKLLRHLSKEENKEDMDELTQNMKQQKLDWEQHYAQQFVEEDDGEGDEEGDEKKEKEANDEAIDADGDVSDEESLSDEEPIFDPTTQAVVDKLSYAIKKSLIEENQSDVIYQRLSKHLIRNPMCLDYNRVNDEKKIKLCQLMITAQNVGLRLKDAVAAPADSKKKEECVQKLQEEEHIFIELVDEIGADTFEVFCALNKDIGTALVWVLASATHFDKSLAKQKWWIAMERSYNITESAGKDLLELCNERYSEKMIIFDANVSDRIPATNLKEMKEREAEAKKRGNKKKKGKNKKKDKAQKKEKNDLTECEGCQEITVVGVTELETGDWYCKDCAKEYEIISVEDGRDTDVSMEDMAKLGKINNAHLSENGMEELSDNEKEELGDYEKEK